MLSFYPEEIGHLVRVFFVTIIEAFSKNKPEKVRSLEKGYNNRIINTINGYGTILVLIAFLGVLLSLYDASKYGK